MTYSLADLLAEARSELDMIEAAGPVFNPAARAKARERVRLLSESLRLPVLVSCGDCAHYRVHSCARCDAPDRCDQAKRDLPREDVIPEWCPLRSAP